MQNQPFDMFANWLKQLEKFVEKKHLNENEKKLTFL